MQVETDAEVLRLRGLLRDLVALSAIPTAWVGSEPSAVTAGFADALVDLLQLDFAFVRLSDPGGAGAVEVTRGSAWTNFPEWLEGHLATSAPFPRKEVFPVAGDDSAHGRGIAVPVGVNGEGGVVVAASQRSDFPTPTDQLLLSLAANHAATAFQSARLVHERTRAEEELRKARNELEVKVAERTTELQRSEAYLADAQRLTHTGSFATNAAKVPTHLSAEMARLYGFDPEHGVPSLEEFLQRIHPEDRARWVEALERGIREAEGYELDFRIDLPQTPLKYIHAIAHPVFTASGELEEFVGTIMDVTERKHAEEERRAQLWFFESMDGINRAIQGTSDLEQMLGDVLDVVLAIFGCDRAWLIYPCDPEVASHRVRMERTRPEYTGAFGLDVEIPNDPEVAGVVRSVLASESPVRFDPESDSALPSAPAEHFSIKSMIAMAVYPKVDKPYMFGLHQCSHPRVWAPQEEKLFQEIGRRLAAALDTLVMFGDLRESERRLEGSRAELAASRARIVTAADETRRRIERDLHDGVQQRLVSLAFELRATEAAVPPDGELKAQLAHTAIGLEGAIEDLVEISRGIHPAILSHGGLGPALKTLARRSAVPVELDANIDSRLPEQMEVAAYYVVSEALTNAAKHASAAVVHVEVVAGDRTIRLSIRDDGVGGADPGLGSGLVGLQDRVEAIGGSIRVRSRPGEGTQITAELPLEATGGNQRQTQGARSG